MKFRLAVAAAIVLALAATTASAGVVISEKVDEDHQGVEHKSNQTVIVQGHKQKVITPDTVTITDLDAGKIYILKPQFKEVYKVGFPPTGVFAMRMVMEGSDVEMKNTGHTSKVAGYACNNYLGTMNLPQHKLDMAKCVASDAPGAKEFMAYQEEQAKKLKGKHLVPEGEIPDGIPVSTTSIMSQLPWVPSPKIPPDVAAKMAAAMAKTKPVIVKTTVSKIEVRDVPPSEFAVPAGYKEGTVEVQTPQVQIKHGKQTVKTIGGPAASGSSAQSGAPAAAASPAAPAH
jgi:hypothetical protein